MCTLHAPCDFAAHTRAAVCIRKFVHVDNYYYTITYRAQLELERGVDVEAIVRRHTIVFRIPINTS